jgi:hypothetical protein
MHGRAPGEGIEPHAEAAGEVELARNGFGEGEDGRGPAQAVEGDEARLEPIDARLERPRRRVDGERHERSADAARHLRRAEPVRVEARLRDGLTQAPDPCGGPPVESLQGPQLRRLDGTDERSTDAMRSPDEGAPGPAG